MNWKANIHVAFILLAFAGPGFVSAVHGAETSNASRNTSPANSSVPPPFPLQLEMQVPFEPTVYPSAGLNYLTYELYLRNFGRATLNLRRIEIFDAGDAAVLPIAIVSEEQLAAVLQPIGTQLPEDRSAEIQQLGGGASVVVFLSIPIEPGIKIPDTLLHRVVTSDSALSGAPAGTRHNELKTLGPPLQGENWRVSGGPNNNEGHRRGILVFDGRARISRRYAMDWVQIENGVRHAGDELDNRAYFAYGEPVLAVADSVVVSVSDGIPENVPGRNRAVPMSLDTVPGNSITLDLGGGQYARYMHLQPGSLRVKAGDNVQRGEVLALVGNTGDSNGPHLHFEVTTEAHFLAGEGVPYVFDEYRILSSSAGPTGTRTHELPMPAEDMLVGFGNPDQDFSEPQQER